MSNSALAATKTTQALLDLRNLRREFPAGDSSIAVLSDINLQIHAGEMVAIVGASGSGKSTLMNILGCLDQPSAGEYYINGRATGTLDANELAELRRTHFGFIFQRYHLLSDLTAQGNVEVPAVYAHQSRTERHARSQALLTRLGLLERMHYRPGQLSGGQQQRVSIARALMNGGHIILADEPTGALDSHSGEEVLQILHELHADNHTIIIVTHDMKVAENAERIIEISDGKIVADRLLKKRPSSAPNSVSTPQNAPAAAPQNTPQNPSTSGQPNQTSAPSAATSTKGTIGAKFSQFKHLQMVADSFLEALRMALIAMNAHRLRTFLTMLGIIIGIASVVAVVALGEGSRQSVLKSISSIGTNTIEIYAGAGFGDRRASAVRTLVPADALALAQQSYVDSVTPNVSTTATIRYRNIEASASINGVSSQYFQVKDVALEQGVIFTARNEQLREQVVVIDQTTKNKLFSDNRNPLGEVILLGNVPVRIIGVTEKKDSAFGNSDSLNVFIPYTTAMGRIIRQNYVRSITVRVSDNASTAAAEQGISELLEQRHGRKDFFTFNTDEIRATIESTTRTLTLLISSIAIISLIVGGIGVMNIMLVSVTERTSEIGVRMAVGARQRDIQQQFLIEAVLVCVVGGILGIALALLAGLAFSSLSSEFSVVFSTSSMLIACLCSCLIGIIFGFLPARSAAQLNPVQALARA